MESFISAIGTATPERRIAQGEIAHFMAKALHMNDAEESKLQALYRASGIQQRFTVVDDYAKTLGNFTFLPNSGDLEPFPSVSARMKLFKEKSGPLGAKAAMDCLSHIDNYDVSSVTHLITVSCTGMNAPGLDIDLVQSLGLSSSVRRTGINFMGCYAAFNALKVADTICRSYTDSHVLVVCVELCTIHFQKNNDEDNLLANALFADGAAAALVTSKPLNKMNLSLEEFHCEILPSAQKEMAWDIGDFGFEMKLSSEVPEAIKGGIERLSIELLEKLELTIDDVNYLAIHPGGKKILQVIEEKLGLPKSANHYAYEILKNYGNMSSPTILFVLKELLSDIKEADANKNILSFAFGPGLTLESMLLKVRIS